MECLKAWVGQGIEVEPVKAQWIRLVRTDGNVVRHVPGNATTKRQVGVEVPAGGGAAVNVADRGKRRTKATIGDLSVIDVKEIDTIIHYGESDLAYLYGRLPCTQVFKINALTEEPDRSIF